MCNFSKIYIIVCSHSSSRLLTSSRLFPDAYLTPPIQWIVPYWSSPHLQSFQKPIFKKLKSKYEVRLGGERGGDLVILVNFFCLKLLRNAGKGISFRVFNFPGALFTTTISAPLQKKKKIGLATPLYIARQTVYATYHRHAEGESIYYCLGVIASS